MDVTLYKNFSVPSAMNKNITQVAKYVGVQLAEPTDDDEVDIRMTVPTDTLKWSNVNYFAWDGAYYFLNSVTKQANSISIIHGEMDPLMTFPDAVKQLLIMASRSTSHGSSRLADSMRTISVDSERTVVNFPNQIPDSEATGRYVLVTSQSGYTGVRAP